MNIRKAVEKDNDALVELARACPMRGSVSVYVDRGPDYFEFTRLQGDKASVWVAEENGRILGCVTHTAERFCTVVRGSGWTMEVI